MKCSLSILLMIFLIKVGVAQTDTVRYTTAKQVYTRFINVIGGEDRLKSVFTIQYGEVDYDSTNRITTKSISAEDKRTLQYGRVSYGNSPSKVDIVKLITTNGKSYSFVNDKKLGEVSLPQETMLFESIFSDLFIRWSEGELLPMEVIDGEEAYVIKYRHYDNYYDGIILYDYFSKRTGLLMARKVFSMLPNGKSLTIYSLITDYRNIDGIMYSHKVFSCKELSQKSCYFLRAYYDVSFNVDFDYFKNVIFKNPKVALDRIPH